MRISAWLIFFFVCAYSHFVDCVLFSVFNVSFLFAEDCISEDRISDYVLTKEYIDWRCVTVNVYVSSLECDTQVYRYPNSRLNWIILEIS